eukprot:695028-Prymnesium_polylepis.1
MSLRKAVPAAIAAGATSASRETYRQQLLETGSTSRSSTSCQTPTRRRGKPSARPSIGSSRATPCSPTR